MKPSQHAMKRMQQRGIRKQTLELLLIFGGLKLGKGNAIKFFIGKKESNQAVAELKKVIQLLDKARGRTMVISEDKIITVY